MFAVHAEGWAARPRAAQSTSGLVANRGTILIWITKLQSKAHSKKLDHNYAAAREEAQPMRANLCTPVAAADPLHAATA